LKKNNIELEMPSKLENIKIIRDFLRKYLEIEKIGKKSSLQLISAVDELVTNVVEHAYKNKENEDNKIKFLVNKKENKVYLTIEDFGTGFIKNENNEKDPDRGMGLKIAKGMVDEFKVVNKSIGTKIEIIKELK